METKRELDTNDKLLRIPADLQEIIDAWPELDGSLKAAVMAVVHSAQM